MTNGFHDIIIAGGGDRFCGPESLLHLTVFEYKDRIYQEGRIIKEPIPCEYENE
jgi:hypothetical protein